MNGTQWIDDWEQNTPGSSVTEYNDSYYLYCDDYALSVPKEFNSSTPVTIYRYGSGGFNKDSTIAIDYANSHKLNQFTIFPNNGNDYETVYGKLLPLVIDNNGLTDTKVTDAGYSCHYITTIQQSAQYLRENPNAAPFTIITIDGKNGGYDEYGLQEFSKLSDNDLQTLEKNGCSIYVYEKTLEMEDSKQLAALQRVNNAGIEVTMIYGDNDHGKERDHAVESGLFKLTSGAIIENQVAEEFDQKIKIMENGELRDASYDEITGKKYTIVKLGNTKDFINPNGTIKIGTIKIDDNFIDHHLIKTNTTLNNFKEHPLIGDKTNESNIISCLNLSFSTISKNRETVLGDVGFFSTLLQSMQQSYQELDNGLANIASRIFESSEIIPKIGNIISPITNKLAAINNTGYLPNINVFNYFNESNGKISYNMKDILSYMESSNPIMKALYNDLNDYNTINRELQSFINESTKNLVGKEWDLLRGTAKSIVEEVNIEIKNVEKEINQRKLVLAKTKEYLEKYDSLDENKIESVKQEITRIEEQIRKLEEAKRQYELARYVKT